MRHFFENKFLFCLDYYWQTYKLAAQNSRLLKAVTVMLLAIIVSTQRWELLIPAFLLLLIAVIDLQQYIIPDLLLVCMMLSKILTEWCLGQCSIAQIFVHVANGLAVGIPLLLFVLLMDRLLQKEAMGGGDIKLMFTIGFCSNAVSAYMVLYLACAVGMIWQVYMQWKKGAYLLPFGPSIAIASGIILLYGAELQKNFFCILW